MTDPGDRGFTLVEIMIVVAIIGILASIAIPNFMRARVTAMQTTCISNMKQIQGATQIWALDTGAASNATPGTGDLVPYYIKVWPKCGTSTYEAPGVSSDLECPNVALYPDHHL